jgi:flagellar hook-associated protein 1 FlgK
MSSIFGLLSLGSQALLTNQKSINVTNENIANQYSDGYARQNVSLQDIVPEGVDVKKIERIFDNNLFKRYLSLNQQVNSDETYSNLLSQIESMFNDIQGTGFYDNINKFFNSFSDLTVNPDDPAARDSVISAAQQLVSKIRDTYNNMIATRDEISSSIKDNVNRVNDILTNIANLNKDIKAFRFDETRLNNYLNQRDQLLKELSSYLDVKVVYRDDNTADIFTVKGHPLVVYDHPYKVDFETKEDGVIVKVNTTDLTSEFKNGQIGAKIKAISFINQKINDLNDFTALLASSVNKIHRNGYDLNGNTGVDFFKISPDSSLNYINASNIDLNVTDYKQIAIAADPNYLNSDNSIAKSILALKDFNQISTKITSNAVSSSATFTGGSFDLIFNNQKVATINYASTDTISDIVNKINSSQNLVVAKLYENTPSSGNFYIQFYAKDISLSPSIDIQNDTGSFLSSTGGLSNYNSLYNLEEKASLTSTSGLQIGSTFYKISNLDNLNILNSKSFQELYTKRFTSEIGLEIENAKNSLDASKNLRDAIQSKIEENSGVNLDEELVNLTKFQRAYQSAAKIINVTDELLQTLLSIV